jgi:hypothetical protein
MLAQMRYRELAIIRGIVLFAFIIVLLTLHKDFSVISVAWLLQGMLVLQGVALLFFTRSFFRRRVAASSDA